MAAQQARSLAQILRLSSSHTQCVSSRASQLQPSRRFSAEHHGPAKVNFWEDPMSPSKWKDEHFVLWSLSGWGVLIYSGYKFFTGGKKDATAEGRARVEYSFTYSLFWIALRKFKKDLISFWRLSFAREKRGMQCEIRVKSVVAHN